jgi:hypothetical protein
MLTLEQAARLIGTSKTSLTRAIKTGMLTATRRDSGYEIDPAKLASCYIGTPETAMEAELRDLRDRAARLRDSVDAWQGRPCSSSNKLLTTATRSRLTDH